MAARIGRALALLTAFAAAGCELQETTVVEVQDVIVAEAYALVGVPSPVAGVEERLWVFLTRTVGGDQDLGVPGARVRVRRSDGAGFRLRETDVRECLREGAVDRPGTCYDAGVDAIGIRPGDELSLEIEVPDGRVLVGETRIPGTFSVEGGLDECALPADTPFEIRWTPSRGASAYVNETRIGGLDEALAPEGIPAPSDLYLLGLSISAADTTIVFPGEFGVFDRFDLDQALSVRLQRGLPAGVQALVGISATDQNYVNWARGGNFNPSGQVRIPSVRGDGTGVFASAVMRRLTVFVGREDPAEAMPSCPGT